MAATAQGEPLTYEERAPRPELSAIADRIWFLRGPSPQRYEKILPLPFIHLIVNLAEPYRILSHGTERSPQLVDGAFVSGIQPTYLFNENPAHLHHVGVQLRPTGLRAISTGHVGDAVMDASLLLNGTARLREWLLKSTSPAHAIDLLEDQLLSWLRPEWRPNPTLESAIELIHDDPGTRMATVAEAIGTTPKHLIDLFKAHCGITPKRYADVYRHFLFLRAIPDEPPFPTWAELVANAGYYDQPHFIRAFARFTGLTPRQYLESKARFDGATPSFLPADSSDAG